jgi:prepilin-type N-terminal cleavage/methylation domain-containing protein
MNIKLRQNKNNQRGFTLVEIIVSLALMALIGGGIATTVYQTININTISNNQMLAIRQVQNLGYYLNLDIHMSESTANGIIPGINNGFPLEINWDYQDYPGGQKHHIVYDIINGTSLQRSDTLNDSTTSTIIVAEYISSISFDGHTLTVTATVGEQSETRTYEITARTG